MITRELKPIPKLNGFDEKKILRCLRHAVACLELESPRKFLTNGLICREYHREFPHHNVPNWYLRMFLREPWFTLDDHKGWRSRVGIFNAEKTKRKLPSNKRTTSRRA